MGILGVIVQGTKEELSPIIDNLDIKGSSWGLWLINIDNYLKRAYSYSLNAIGYAFSINSF
mgnify:CR=1 FL=1